MALLSRRIAGLPVWWFILSAIVLAALVQHGVSYWRGSALNREIAAPETVMMDERTPPLLRFAKAFRLGGNGQTAEAAQLYASLLQTESAKLREYANYNLGTLYLSEAARLWNERGVLEYTRVNTLVELAKENFRQALRLNPDNWDARYNLEYAFRITPPPKEKAKSDWRGSKSSVFSTLPGIPGGGP